MPNKSHILRNQKVGFHVKLSKVFEKLMTDRPLPIQRDRYQGFGWL
jgi:hypothetical protein